MKMRSVFSILSPRNTSKASPDIPGEVLFFQRRCNRLSFMCYFCFMHLEEDKNSGTSWKIIKQIKELQLDVNVLSDKKFPDVVKRISKIVREEYASAGKTVPSFRIVRTDDLTSANGFQLMEELDQESIEQGREYPFIILLGRTEVLYGNTLTNAMRHLLELEISLMKIELKGSLGKPWLAPLN